MNKATIPMQFVGPIKVIGPEIDVETTVPLATFETPLWASTNRGARVTLRSGGIQAVVIDERMSRSIVLQASDVLQAKAFLDKLPQQQQEMAEIVSQSSRFAKLINIHTQVVGNLIYLRCEFTTGDASGHNMVTLACDHLMRWLLQKNPELTYISISANFCTDKKASAVNGILGRGKNVVTEIIIPRKLCTRYLKTAPEKIVELNIKKNHIGTNLAGGLRSANAHYANMLLGFYLATGQDAANIIEGSQGIVHAEMRGEDLYFSASLPNVIVGSIGNGKDLEFVRDNLKHLGCLEKREPGENARRLALLAASTVLCGELSLLAAQTNEGELMESHIRLERKSTKRISYA